MRAIIQRVSSSSVTVDTQLVGKINKGFNVLLGVKIGDTEKDADYICDKILGLRIFSDQDDKMNLSIQDINGEILLISQFTLYADARKGKRPSFSSSAKFDDGKVLYEYTINRLKNSGLTIEHGIYGADMKVLIANDGPVTIMLDSERQF